MSDDVTGPFWHQHNPWADRVIYVTDDEWLDCLAFQEQRDHYIEQMERNPFYDPYILPQPDGEHSMGLRLGRNEPNYLSPMCNAAKAQKLIDKYRSEDGQTRPQN